MAAESHGEGGSGGLAGLQAGRLGLAARADQNDGRDAFALDALHVPAGAHGFLGMRQTMVAIPAAALAGRADGA